MSEIERLREKARTIALSHARCGPEMKAGFDPHQLRDPHTGEWIESVGGSISGFDLPEVFAQTLDDVTGAIASVHGYPSRASVRVTKGQSREESIAAADFTPGGANRVAVIRLNDLAQGFDSDHRAATLVHELGHFADTTFSRDDVRGVLAEIRDSGAIERLNTGYRKMMSTYFQNDDELFARAYAQWIAGRTGLGKEALDQDVESGQQWTDAEFVPIAAAFERLFEKRHR